MDSARLTVLVRGRVQGVGFRWWARARALELGVSGWARNRPDGRVEIVAQGERAALEELLDLLSGGRTPGRVLGVASTWSALREPIEGFCER